MRRAASLVIAATLLSSGLILGGCSSSSGVAPVESRAAPPSRDLRLHIVSRGDTLYSIAFRYERDFRDLARINRLDSNYTLQPGQHLYLTEAAAVAAGSQPRPAATGASATAAAVASPLSRPVIDEGPVDSVRTTTAPTPVTATAAPPPATAAPAATPAPVRTATPSVAPTPAPPVAASTPRPASTPMPPMASTGWNWPHPGRLVTSFGRGQPVSRGIVLGGDLGSPVLAAGSGQVVYAGAGLRGYGNLIIIKHDESHLSAYGYNRDILVREGESVGPGQRIATVGNDAEGNPRLYFEIRRDGTPVDPMRYLPAR